MNAALVDHLEALLDETLEHSANVEVRPVVVLWPDETNQFGALADQIGQRRPLLRMGDYDPDRRQGPAYWLRCVIARAIDVPLSDGTPIVYLPGVGRDDLRAIEQCPRTLAPIAELQYRGVWFAHPNGRDWTIRSLLTNTERGVGLTVKDDTATTDALLDAFPKLLTLPIHQLQSSVVDASYLQDLLAPDLTGSMLAWIDDPSGFRTRTDEGHWKAFAGQARKTLDLNPDKDGELTAAQKLGEAAGPWGDVWARYATEPEKYPGIEGRLRKAKPDSTLFDQVAGETWPQDNEAEEAELRKALDYLKDSTAKQARAAIDSLWAAHRHRQSWVWATLDRSPLVFALEHLRTLADLTSSALTGDVAALAMAYADGGWRADQAFLDVLGATTEDADRAAVTVAALALYRPWVDANAEALQSALTSTTGGYIPGAAASTAHGTATLFIDGFRLDLAHRLATQLDQLDVDIDTAMAALPTVTATAKPALIPMDDGALVGGKALGPAKPSGAEAGITVWRALLEAQGVHVLTGADTGDPSGAAWSEAGDIDKRGHDFGAALVDELDNELRAIAKRIQRLLDAGWMQVDVVTDHGWVLIPGGLPKVELPVAVTETKKGRCARLKPGANVSVPTVAWHWDPDVRIAIAPGISCFEQGKEYEHGGISLQECVVPRMHIRVSAQRSTTTSAAITQIKWLGLRCRVEYDNVAPGATVDVRAMPGEPSSSVAQDPRDTLATGKASLLVPDEDLEGEAAYVVVVAPDGTILAQRETTIGRNG